MPTFVVKLENDEGQILSQRHDSVSALALRRNLESRGLLVLEMKRSGGHARTMSLLSLFRGVKPKDLLVFNQEFLVLLKAGLPIVKALDTILERTANREFAGIIGEVREDVRNGYALSDAMSKFTSVFPELYVASIKAGEQSGDLPTIIRRFIEFSKKAKAAREKVVSAMIYPAILVTVATGAILFLLIYVVPTFSQVYLESGQKLPGPTQVLLTVTGLIRDNAFVLVGIIVAGVVGLNRFLRSEGGSRARNRLMLKLPYVGNLVSKYSFTKLCQVLATTLTGGIPLVPSLRLGLQTMGNRFLQEKLEQAIKKVEEGFSLTQALTETEVVPAMMIRLVGVGESTGSLPEMLTETATFYEEEIDHQVTVLTAAFEPAVMVFMGLIVASILVAMYLPIFNLAETVR